ncbi:hypothetical protein E4U91_21795 [Streptomyces lasalocidi]|uniref:Uncharacterized protein n=1 Tax=Streptomyces lasalocidi TaxID=324833 RepID=A0A4U5WK88_STRLS|nr:hypothetical protein E4U91_21795 [Streptomyces lasalocidi]
MQLQGGGGRRRGAMGAPPARAKPRVGETDDNAADARAGPRDAGMIQTTGPRQGEEGRSRFPRQAEYAYSGAAPPGGGTLGECCGKTATTSRRRNCATCRTCFGGSACSWPWPCS